MYIEFHKHLSYPSIVEEKEIISEFPDIRKLSLRLIAVPDKLATGLDGVILEMTHNAWFYRLMNRLNDIGSHTF